MCLEELDDVILFFEVVFFRVWAVLLPVAAVIGVWIR